MKVRPYQSDDAPALSALYARSVLELGVRDYGPEQMAAWAALAPTPERLEELAADGRVRLVAVDADDRAVAFADLRPDGHIDMLYRAPGADGAGSAVYDELERVARRRGIPTLTSDASEAARRFFLGKGFTIRRRRDFAVAGVAIHNYAVSKDLTYSQSTTT